MGGCVIIPVGVTKETVLSLVSVSRLNGGLKCLLAVTVAGLEEEKRSILAGLEDYARSVGLVYRELWIREEDYGFASELLEFLLEQRPSRIYLSLLSGSRYLYPLLTQVLLYYWRRTGAKVYVLQGVEGGSWRVEPLSGYYSVELPRSQRRVFKEIYEYPGDELRTREDLVEKHGYGRSVYKILRELESKGLIEWGRNRIRKTLPGKILYELMEVSDGGV